MVSDGASARAPRAVVYGVGAMGTVIAKFAIEKGVEVVGAIARSPEKVGHDLGEVANLGFETGVIVEDDPSEVFSTREVDIALIATVSPIGEMFEQYRVCIDHGVNAISLSEEWLFPWLRYAKAAEELDQLAKRGGVTITAGGHQDAYWVNLVALLMGTAHKIDSVVGRTTWNPDDYGPVAADFMPIDLSVEEFEQFVASGEGPPSYGDSVVGALAAHAGLTVSDLSSRRMPVVAAAEMTWRSLERQVASGRVIGFTDIDTVETEEGPTLTVEMTGALYGDDDVDVNEWAISGVPNLTLSTPAVETHVTTCTGVVNRIPDVINAAPGFVTVEALPPLRYRPKAFGEYLADR